MDARKRRLDYRRRWTAADRAIKRAHKSLQQGRQNEFPVGDETPNPNFTQSDFCHSALSDSEDEMYTPKISIPIPEEENIPDSDSSISSSDESNADPTLVEEISQWINQYQVTRVAADSLLKTLQRHGHADIPSTCRTLYKRKMSLPVFVKSSMQYAYLGMKSQLVPILQSQCSQYDRVEISCNIDGMQLFKSSSKCVWPILCAVHLNRPVILPIALTLGRSKPDNLEFLEDFIRELKDILKDGVTVNGKKVAICLRCIVCDCPARAMVKNVKFCTGYFGCDKCCQKGTWLGRVTYQQSEHLILRTNHSFRSNQQKEHHHGPTPFSHLNIDMIRDFPIDYMHQACLGVMRKLLLSWMRGSKRTKISSNHILQISRRLEDIQCFIPSSFARKPRSLEEIAHYKATEYRQILLYTGKIVLKDVLNDAMYEHFLHFSVALCILVSPALVRNLADLAHTLLLDFVQQSKVLYGDDFLVYNVHSMLHITEEAKLFGGLDNCSAFPFETFLYRLKRLVRSGKSPLTQMINRLREFGVSMLSASSNVKEISVTSPNNAYILDNGLCCQIVQKMNHGSFYTCKIYTHSMPFFLTPCDSRFIGVYKVILRSHFFKLVPVTMLKRQAVMITVGEFSSVFMAILHLV